MKVGHEGSVERIVALFMVHDHVDQTIEKIRKNEGQNKCRHLSGEA